MGFLERLAGRKKLLDFKVFLGDDEAAVDILRSREDTHWSEPVRLWAAYHALLVHASGSTTTERGREAVAYAAALSEQCEPGMLLVNLVPTVVKPVAYVSGSFYSFRGSERRIALAPTALSMDDHRLVSVALFQWAFSTLGVGESHLQFLGRVAYELFSLYDDPEASARAGGPLRLAQSASNIAFSRALALQSSGPPG